MTLKVGFSDFWADFDPEHNFFIDILNLRFKTEISTNPDIVFCSTFGTNWTNYECPRVFFSGENILSDTRHFDASLTFAPNSSSNYYLPLYRLYRAYDDVYKIRTINEAEWRKRKKIATVFSNNGCKFRNRAYLYFKEKLNADSGGKAYNNIGGPVKDKQKFLSQYLFSMTFENASWPGYTTEKIIEAHSFSTIPIYWGDPLVNKVFNSKAFIRVEKFGDLKKIVYKINNEYNDFNKFKEIYEQPLFPDNREPTFLTKTNIADFFEKTVANGITRSEVKPSRQHIINWESRWKTKNINYNWRFLFPFSNAFTILEATSKFYLKKLIKRNNQD